VKRLDKYADFMKPASSGFPLPAGEGAREREKTTPTQHGYSVSKTALACFNVDLQGDAEAA
jgi:hypothetical protein